MPIDLPTPVVTTVNDHPVSYVESQKLPPSYSQIDLNEEKIIYKQPASIKNLPNNYNSLSDLMISGYVVNQDYKNNIVSFNTNVAENYAAFFDDSNCIGTSLCIKPMVKIVNKDKLISKINLKNICSLPLETIYLSSDNQKLLLTFMNNKNNKEVYLVENSNSQSELTANANFNKVTKLSPPLKDISSVSFDDNNNIIATGINNGTVDVYTENDSNWNLETTLTVDGVYDVIFSDSRSCLYALSRRNIFDKKQYILSVYLINNKFKLAGETENTTCYPNDIDSAYETVVFINGKTLTIKSLINNIEVSTDFENKLIIARFIPETKDILLFNDKRQMYLLKCNDFEKLSYCIKDTKKLSVVIKNAYFDSNDKNNLKIIVNNTNKNDIYIMLAGGICGNIPGSFVGIHTSMHFIKNTSIANFFKGFAIGSIPVLVSQALGIFLGFVVKDIYDASQTKKITLQPDGSHPKLENLYYKINKNNNEY
jgi:hypothetical protein